nr:MAG TPA: hypothetical protein [Caudoviricetes sp.]
MYVLCPHQHKDYKLSVRRTLLSATRTHLPVIRTLTVRDTDT